MKKRSVPMVLNEIHAEDVAAASAAYVYNLLPELAKLSPPEGFRRLYDLFHTAIVAYVESQCNWGLRSEPSKN
jgi:hypothetical protein